jgi:hypothetical protein
MTKIKLPIIFLMIVSAAGCGPQFKKPLKICPGKANAEEAIGVLGGQIKNIVPLTASGDCTIVYQVDGKLHSPESLRLQLRIEPPLDVYLQGGSIIGKTVELGANDREFWMQLWPKEVSTYLWGVWADEGVRQCINEFWLGPETWLETFGIVKVATAADAAGVWELSHKGSFDILSRKTMGGVLTKKVYVYCCDYHVRKIEYFDSQGRAATVIELDDYVPVVKGGDWKVPRKIHIKNSENETLDVELKNVAKGQFNDKQRQLWFQRPNATGFEHVGRMNSACEFVEKASNP